MVDCGGESSFVAVVADVGVWMFPDKADIKRVIGIAGEPALSFGEVEHVHPGVAPSGGVGVGDTERWDPVFLGGKRANAELVVCHGGIDLRVLYVDPHEHRLREISEFSGSCIVAGMRTYEESALIAVGADQETLVFGRASGDVRYGKLMQQIVVYFRAKGKVLRVVFEEFLLDLKKRGSGCREEIAVAAVGLRAEEIGRASCRERV